MQLGEYREIYFFVVFVVTGRKEKKKEGKRKKKGEGKGNLMGEIESIYTVRDYRVCLLSVSLKLKK